ncbi:MAG: hypothetical protein ABMA01_20565 [Chthoniobacteraceae bacterium]
MLFTSKVAKTRLLPSDFIGFAFTFEEMPAAATMVMMTAAVDKLSAGAARKRLFLSAMVDYRSGMMFLKHRLAGGCVERREDATQ